MRPSAFATVCFCHGRESGPWGTKIRSLARVAEGFGCAVLSCDDRDLDNPDERVERLVELAESLAEPLVLVGSSMGGYVAAVASAQLKPAGLFLMAPAIGLPGYAVAAPRPVAPLIAVVHGWRDTIVAAEHVIAFARDCRATLHLLEDDHLLQAELERVARLFGDFLSDCLGSGESLPARELTASL